MGDNHIAYPTIDFIKLIGSTKRNISAPGDEDVKIGLNVYRYNN